MTMDLTTQRARLAAPNPILAQQAVVGIFHHLQEQHGKLGLDLLRPFLEPCLSHGVKGVINEAVDRLCSLVYTGRLDPADASDLLLSCLPTASPPGVGLLAQGLCRLQIQSAAQLQAPVQGKLGNSH
ncbi:hypothetical protein DUNSADRAFT_8952 [Dunaliella salina]|uniref:Uncharacterized protein n=1 Tax=Dunaliella salina TaxID=3046 RepID=A0ABQ7GIF9_DUNSA|nr:hypothetical protein DUNSADRAFT_8952 [Dunaliella salina]|eukprot:KAF5834397.1 hypothetical protein DUNSADRAFT_8952 [Dunaliella salina]